MSITDEEDPEGGDYFTASERGSVGPSTPSRLRFSNIQAEGVNVSPTGHFGQSNGAVVEPRLDDQGSAPVVSKDMAVEGNNEGAAQTVPKQSDGGRVEAPFKPPATDDKDGSSSQPASRRVSPEKKGLRGMMGKLGL